MSRFAVIGGGLAGRCVAQVLGDVDLYDISASRASNVPAAICHPYPGRSFDGPASQWSAWAVTAAWFERFSVGVMPVLVHRQADARLLSSLKRISMVTVPVEVCDDGFRYGGAWVVDVPHFLTQLEVGGDRFIGRAHVNGNFVVFKGQRRAYEAVVVCPGVALGEWTSAPVEVVHGDLATFEGMLTHARFGACHAYPNLQGHVTLGHAFLTTPRSDFEVETDYRRRAAADGIELGSLLGIWRGARATIQHDRQPVLAHIGGGTYVLGGLGAKGLLFAPMLAEQIAEHLLRGAELPAEYSWPRA